jgi:hypothetical protein
MNGSRAVLTALVGSAATSAFAASEDAAQPHLQKAHPVHPPTIGCGPQAELRCTSNAIFVHGIEEAAADPAGKDCRLVTTFRGPVVDEGD